jgi:hypothetical protein
MISKFRLKKGFLDGLAVRQEVLLDVVTIRLEEDVGAALVADLLFGTLDHAMALAGLGIDNFTCAGDFEALFSARFRFQLGHFALPCINPCGFVWFFSGLIHRSSRRERIIRHGSPNQPVGSSGAYDGFMRERQGEFSLPFVPDCCIYASVFISGNSLAYDLSLDDIPDRPDLKIIYQPKRNI